MFLDFYKFLEQPFGVTADPRFLYLARNHREALASLLFAIENGLGFSTLIAEPGLGKTTLLLRVLETLGATALTAFFFETQCSSAGLLRHLLKELNIQTAETDVTALHEKVEEFLEGVARSGQRVVVIIDEAQTLEPPALETMRLLSNFETPRAKLIHVILSGQPQLAERLTRPDMAQLQQRVSMASWLRPLTGDETARYIDHRLRVAGYRSSPLFSDEATDAIAAYSEGVPRKINHLCFNVLSLGCLLGENHIGKGLVEEAGFDMGMRLLALQQPPNAPLDGRAGKKVADPAPQRTYSGTDSQQADEQLFTGVISKLCSENPS